jgi:hypothetical protein
MGLTRLIAARETDIRQFYWCAAAMATKNVRMHEDLADPWLRLDVQFLNRDLSAYYYSWGLQSIFHFESSVLGMKVAPLGHG